MNEDYDVSYEASDSDCEDFGDVSDVSSEDVGYDTFDDIPDDEFVDDGDIVDDAGYNDLDDVPDLDFDEDAEGFESEFDDASNDVYNESEYETLEEVPDELSEELPDDVTEPETLEEVPDELSEELPDDVTEPETLEEAPDELSEELPDDVTEPEMLEEVPDELSEEVQEETTELDETSETNPVIKRIMDSDLSLEQKRDLLQQLRDDITSVSDTPLELVDDGLNQQEWNQDTEYYVADGDTPKILKKDITDEVWESRYRDTEETLDNYRDNLREYGVDEDVIEAFVNQERDKIYAEYESLDNGDTSSNIYYTPTDWEGLADQLKDPDVVSDLMNTNKVEIQDINDITGWLNDINPNFDEFDPDSPYCNNCGSCALAVYNRLNGDMGACASADNIPYNEQMNAITGMEQVSMSPAEIERRLLNEGDGAHAIIGIDRAEGPGHWFNAACVNGKVVAIDGQTGEISDWPPDYGDVVNWEMSVKK